MKNKKTTATTARKTTARKPVARAKTLNSYIREFGKAYDRVRTSVSDMSRIYVDALGAYGDAAHDAFQKRYPSVRECTWATLRHIGNGDLIPSAVLYSDAMKSKLLSMPIERQETIVVSGKGFEYVDPATDTVKFALFEDITPAQAKIVFTENNHLRSVEEQRVFIARNPTVVASHTKPPYRIEGDKLIVCRKCTLGIREIKRILKTLEANDANNGGKR